MAERWRNIVSYPDYEVSNEGRVRNKRKQKMLKPHFTNKYGHQQVTLFCDGKRTHCYIHRLVLEAFVETQPKGLQTRHLNGNPTDNRVENLKWGTYKENCADSIRHGTHVIPTNRVRGEKHPRAKVNEVEVKEIRSKYVPYLYSARMLAREYGIGRTAVLAIVNGKHWVHL